MARRQDSKVVSLLVGTPDGVKVKPIKAPAQKANDITLQARESFVQFETGMNPLIPVRRQ